MMLNTVIEMANRRSAVITFGSCRGAAGFAFSCCSAMSPLLGLRAELERVPARGQLKVLLVELAVAVAPLQVRLHRPAHVAESDVDLVAALAGVPAAAVDVVDELAAVRRGH